MNIEEYEVRDFASCIKKHLPESEVKLLDLRYDKDLTYKEIGREYGVGGTRIRQAIDEILKTCRLIARRLDKGLPVIVEPSLVRGNLCDGKLTKAQDATRKRMNKLYRKQVRDEKRKKPKKRNKKGFMEYASYEDFLNQREVEREFRKTHEVREYIDLDGYKFAAWVPKDASAEEGIDIAMSGTLFFNAGLQTKIKKYYGNI